MNIWLTSVNTLNEYQECLDHTLSTLGPLGGTARHGEDAGRRLGEVRTRLNGMLGSVETTFLNAGEKLGTAVDALSSVPQTFDRLATVVASEDLDVIVGRLKDIPQALAAASAVNDRGAAALQRIEELARGLERPLARLRKTLAEVQVLAINGRVEAAHVTAATIDFSVFTRDMGVLTSQGMATLDRLGRELGQLNHLTGMRSERKARACTEGDTLAKVAPRLRASVDAITLRRQEAGDSARLVGELSTANAASIGQAIGALQIGDIARQRVEHVMLALDGADPTRLGPLCRLQGMQLDNARHELQGEVDRARATFVRLAEDAGALRSRAAEAFRSGVGSRSFLHALAADLRVAMTAMEAYYQDARDLQERLEPVIRSVAEMAAHVRSVRDIEADMRIMGLNATFKCGHLGNQGRALGVIAQALRTQAGQTADYAGQVMAGLEEISAVTRGMVDAGGANVAGVLDTLRDAVTAFEGGGQAMDQALTILGEKVDTAVSALIEVQTCFDADAMVAGLAADAVELARLADDLGAPSVEHGEWAHELASSYTMASQRDIHARFSGTLPGQDTVHPPQTCLDDIFF